MYSISMPFNCIGFFCSLLCLFCLQPMCFTRIREKPNTYTNGRKCEHAHTHIHVFCSNCDKNSYDPRLTSSLRLSISFFAHKFLFPSFIICLPNSEQNSECLAISNADQIGFVVLCFSFTAVPSTLRSIRNVSNRISKSKIQLWLERVPLFFISFSLVLCLSVHSIRIAFFFCLQIILSVIYRLCVLRLVEVYAS